MKKIMTVIICAATAASLTGCSLLNAVRLTRSLKGLPDPRPETEMYILTEPAKTGYADQDEYAYEEYEPELGTSYLRAEAMSQANTAGSGCAYLPEENVTPEWNTEEYKYLEENRWLSPAASPFSTFAADVDTASYANLRRMLLEGRTVPADAVRIEEMINYFNYDYPAPDGEDVFSVSTDIAPCPWNDQTQLLRIGLKAKELPQTQRSVSNLIFLIDVSGSMDEYNKLPLVQRAFRLLVNELGEDDRVSLVTYANGDHIVLEGVPGSEKTKICDAIEDLYPSGGTNGSAGLLRAYELAQENFIEGGNNRVILATDGDLNIGMTDEGSLTRLIEEKAKTGVFLSVLGFGEGNISDTNMEALADHGNGNYSYIDNIGEARKVLISEAGSTLFAVAKDVKLQVEFNPAKVKGYRLIGYENRMMAAESFSDDTKDGGEIGSGHTITALYEIAPAGSSFEIDTVESRYAGQTSAHTDAENDSAGTDEKNSSTGSDGKGSPKEGSFLGEWAILHIRYKQPDADESVLMDRIITDACLADEMDDDFSWAAGVAQAGMLLKQSSYAGDTTLKDVRDRLKGLTGNDEFREEFLYLLTRME